MALYEVQWEEEYEDSDCNEISDLHQESWVCQQYTLSSGEAVLRHR